MISFPTETCTSKSRGQTKAKGGSLFRVLLSLFQHLAPLLPLLEFQLIKEETNVVKCFVLKKGPAKPKKSKEVEKAKPEEKAPEAPAENGEAKAEDDVRGMTSCMNMQNEDLVPLDETCND